MCKGCLERLLPTSFLDAPVTHSGASTALTLVWRPKDALRGPGRRCLRTSAHQAAHRAADTHCAGHGVPLVLPEVS